MVDRFRYARDDTPGNAAHREMILHLLDTYQDLLKEKLGKGLDAESTLMSQAMQALDQLRHKIATAEPAKLDQAQGTVASMVCAMLSAIADTSGDESFKAMVRNYKINYDVEDLRPKSTSKTKPVLH